MTVDAIAALPIQPEPSGQPSQPSTEAEALVMAVLGATTEETSESLQYVLIRGLHAMGFAQPTLESINLARAAIAAVRAHGAAP